MNPTFKRLLIAGCVAILFFTGTICWVALKLTSFIGEDNSNDIPPEIAQPRVLVGEGLFTRSEFFRIGEMGLAEIYRNGGGSLDPRIRERAIHASVARSIYGFDDLKYINGQVIAAARFGGFVLQPDGTVIRTLTFEPTAQNVKIGPFSHTVYFSADDHLRVVEPEPSKIGFSSFGYTQGFVLFNENGDQVFSYGRNHSETLFEDRERESVVLKAAVGDIDGDGIAEIAIAKENEGIHLLDLSGNERWLFKDERANYPLEFADYDRDGKTELLQLGATAIDAGGNATQSLKGINGGVKVVFAEGSSKKDDLKPIFCDLGIGEFTCQITGETKIFTANAPLSRIKTPARQISMPFSGESFTMDSEFVGTFQVILARLKPDSQPMYVVVGGFSGLPRGNFWIFDQTGKLVYHELMPERTESVTAIRLQNGTDQILVGGKSTIWRYVPNS